MTDIPQDYRYTDSHEWVRRNDDGTLSVGVTDHAQNLLGDIVFIELPEADDVLESGTECAVIESVKAAADVYCPLNGEVVAINDQVVDSPALVNTDPYGEGWLFMLQPTDESEFDQLMEADQYNQKIEDA